MGEVREAFYDIIGEVMEWALVDEKSPKDALEYIAGAYDMAEMVRKIIESGGDGASTTKS